MVLNEQLHTTWTATERKQLDEALTLISNYQFATCPFEVTASFLAQTLNIDFVLTGSFFQTPDNQRMIRTLAKVQGPQLTSKIHYVLENKPCEQVFAKLVCDYSFQLKQQLSKDLLLAELGVESWVVAPLNDENDQPIGLIVLLHRKTIEQTPFLEALLSILTLPLEQQLQMYLKE